VSDLEALEAQRIELIDKIQGIDLDLTRRKNNLEALRGELATYENPIQAMRQARRDYEQWRSAALTSRKHALDELIQVKAMIKTTNAGNQDDERGRLRRAIMRHQQEVMDGGYAATPADLALWAELDHLS
jgi:chromosome segregation ATPase